MDKYNGLIGFLTLVVRHTSFLDETFKISYLLEKV